MAILTSCEGYLDRPMETSQSKEITFSSYDGAITVAYGTYYDLPQGLSQIWGSNGSAMLASASDEAEFTNQTHSVQKFNTGAWRPTDLPDNPMSTYYAAIRRAYDFIENVGMVNYDDVKDNPSQPGVYEARLENVEQLKNEVMLLRAFFMFEMVKRFGGIPIISGKLDQNVDYSTIQRSSLQDCVDEIVRWCDETAKVLPARQTNENLGRLTKGAALALKSDVLLWAASELWNNSSWASGYAHPELISLPEGDRKARWKAAADAAMDVIDLIPEAGYALDSYDKLFGADGYRSPEIIFCRRDGAGNSFEKTNLPIHFDLVTGGNCPSQNLVDMFQVKVDDNTAVEFDWSDPDMAADPYANRDPRLAEFIVTNNSTFKGTAIQCWTGGLDGAGVRNATPTGYYIKKYVNPDLDLLAGATSIHTWIYYRLPEIYLNYIEALNEYDPGNADIKTYYDLIRDRAEVDMPGLPSGLDQDEVRRLIRNERAVELCFEGKRWFDLRRWMDSESLGADLRAVEITRNASDGSFTYEPYILEHRSFDSGKMWFYPIPQSEINKMPHWAQNPGW